MDRDELYELARKYQKEHGFCPDEDGLDMFVAGAEMVLSKCKIEEEDPYDTFTAEQREVERLYRESVKRIEEEG